MGVNPYRHSIFHSCFLNIEIPLPWTMVLVLAKHLHRYYLSRNAVGILCEGGHRNEVKVKVI